MLGVGDGSAVYLALHPVDFRRGIAALSSYAREHLQMSGPRALIEGVFGGRFPCDFGELGGIWGVDRSAGM